MRDDIERREGDEGKARDNEVRKKIKQKEDRKEEKNE